MQTEKPSLFQDAEVGVIAMVSNWKTSKAKKEMTCQTEPVRRFTKEVQLIQRKEEEVFDFFV